jgi:hypothetical protein|tara:strand:- start:2172 stop:2348 length:177 start_codon:yes stop_codon:yes gene_type:complete
MDVLRKIELNIQILEVQKTTNAFSRIDTVNKFFSKLRNTQERKYFLDTLNQGELKCGE